MQILVGNEPKVNILSFKKIKYGLSSLSKISISSPREELKQQVISLRASLNANNSKYNFKVNHVLSNKKKTTTLTFPYSECVQLYKLVRMYRQPQSLIPYSYLLWADPFFIKFCF